MTQRKISDGNNRNKNSHNRGLQGFWGSGENGYLFSGSWGFVCLFCLFVFVALRPKSTAMVIAGRSVHLTTLFPGQA